MTQNSTETPIETEVLEPSLDLAALIAAADAQGSQSSTARAANIAGIVIGELTGMDGNRRPLVDFPGNPADSPVPALATVQVSEDSTSRSVVLAFEQGDPSRPILLGLIENPEDLLRVEAGSLAVERDTVEAEVDNERIELTAQREIVLRCGKASITLTRAGKVLIRGAYVSSRSSGVNRIKGGSVHIN